MKELINSYIHTKNCLTKSVLPPFGLLLSALSYDSIFSYYPTITDGVTCHDFQNLSSKSYFHFWFKHIFFIFGPEFNNSIVFTK